MNLRNQILKEHSKANCQVIVGWISGDTKRFNELFHLFLTDEYRVSQRAAWPLSICAIRHPYFINGKFEKLLANLQKPGIHDSIKRNTLRLLNQVDIPEKHEGFITDICFSYVQSPIEAVAVKCFSISILEKLTKKYPEIIPELIIVIEDQLPHQSVGFKGRAKKILKNIK